MRYLLFPFIMASSFVVAAGVSIPDQEGFYSFYKKFRYSLMSGEKKDVYNCMCFPFVARNVDEGEIPRNKEYRKISRKDAERYDLARYFLTWSTVYGEREDPVRDNLNVSYDNDLELFKNNSDPSVIKNIYPDAVLVGRNEISIGITYFKNSHGGWCWYKAIFQTSGKDTPPPLR